MRPQDCKVLSFKEKAEVRGEAGRVTAYLLRQIERARRATWLLRAGVSPTEAAFESGFFDQPHLTRSLRHLVGLTPARIAREERQLSFLYRT